MDRDRNTVVCLGILDIFVSSNVPLWTKALGASNHALWNSLYHRVLYSVGVVTSSIPNTDFQNTI